MDATLALNVHSFLPHRAHSHSFLQEKPLATCNANLPLHSVQKRTRESPPQDTQQLWADSTLLSLLDSVGAEKQLHNFRKQCISKATSNQKAVDTFFRVFGASNCLSAKLKQLTFLTPFGLSVQRLIHQNVRGETKTAVYFSPRVYN